MVKLSQAKRIFNMIFNTPSANYKKYKGFREKSLTPVAQ